MSRHVLLHTEMVTAAALVRGGAGHLLDHDPAEHPVVLQLGGADPRELAAAARMGADAGYDAIDLNCGCPSDRVQSGTFGAVLMRTPARVADCLGAMRAATPVEVSVKCRIGIDEQDPSQALPDFLSRVEEAGVRRVTIHARKAWLAGLSPRENRVVPPLDYDLVHRMRRGFPGLSLAINGGIGSLDDACAQLDAGMAGVMVGRAAYHAPSDILLDADRRVFGDATPARTPEEVALDMLPHIDAHLARGGRLAQVTRHMLGLFAGRPGARSWRRILSEGAHRPGADRHLVLDALASVALRAA